MYMNVFLLPREKEYPTNVVIGFVYDRRKISMEIVNSSTDPMFYRGGFSSLR